MSKNNVIAKKKPQIWFHLDLIMVMFHSDLILNRINS